MTLPDFYRQACDTAAAAAHRAARLIRQHAGRLDQDEIREKGTHDLVTEIDERAQLLIIETLHQAFPDHAFLAEEGSQHDGAPGPYDGFRWIIDPIDGTTNFTHGLHPHAVSIALQEGDAIVVGVVLDVPHGELFTAIRGRGLYVNGAPARVSRTPALKHGVIATGFPYRSWGHVDAYLAVLKNCIREAQSFRRLGSAAIDLAYVACGKVDAYVQTGLSPWDVAAGLLLVREGGGRVTDLHGAEHTGFEHPIVATNGRVHDAMLEVVAPLRDVV